MIMPLALTVGPFPLCINAEQKETFLKYFGALKVNHLSNKKRSSVYSQALFKSESNCEYALKRIHQIQLFDKRINAKYCDILHSKSRVEAHEYQTEKSESHDTFLFNSKYFEEIQRYEALLSSISSNFEVNFPISPKLKYIYPPPSAKVLANVIHTLYSVPKFYTQVLHLMNKMNLPCPFDDEIGELQLSEDVISALKLILDNSNNFNTSNEINVLAEEASKNSEESVCESESELESDEGTNAIKPNNVNPPKRLIRKKNPINKKPKLELLKSSFNDPNLSKRKSEIKNVSITEDIFEKSDMHSLKKMEVRLESVSLPVTPEVAATQIDDIAQGFGKIHPQHKEALLDKKPKEKSQFISIQDLQYNRINQKDWPLVPVFKNYNKGSPTCRLYIKNLAKTVTEADLKFIFGRFINWGNQDEVSNFCIRLLKEGRMKGQAFITFSSEKIASDALGETNGFILKDKPMVIMFGKVKEK